MWRPLFFTTLCPDLLIDDGLWECGGVGVWVQGLKFKVPGSGFRVPGSGFSVQRSAFCVQRFAFCVQRFAFSVLRLQLYNFTTLRPCLSAEVLTKTGAFCLLSFVFRLLSFAFPIPSLQSVSSLKLPTGQFIYGRSSFVFCPLQP